MIVTTFSNLSWRKPSIAHFVSVPHLIQLSLLETVRPEVCVSDKGDSIQIVVTKLMRYISRHCGNVTKKVWCQNTSLCLFQTTFERELGPLWPNRVIRMVQTIQKL